MKNKEFAILHNLKSGQFLVDTTYNHEEKVHELSFKFWCEEINGYAKFTLGWDEEKDFIEAFNSFKSPKFCEEYAIKVLSDS